MMHGMTPPSLLSEAQFKVILLLTLDARAVATVGVSRTLWKS
jgi:hypothetical protein